MCERFRLVPQQSESFLLRLFLRVFGLVLLFALFLFLLFGFLFLYLLVIIQFLARGAAGRRVSSRVFLRVICW